MESATPQSSSSGFLPSEFQQQHDAPASALGRPGRLLHTQAYVLPPISVKPCSARVRLSHQLPTSVGSLMPMTLGSSTLHRNEPNARRALKKFNFTKIVLCRGSGPTRSLVIRALDRSDAVSDADERKQLVSESASFERLAARIDDDVSSSGGCDSKTGMEMEGFVLGVSRQPNAWDSGSIDAPVVRRYLSDNEERWFMWYCGRQRSHQAEAEDSREGIGLAVSSNGLHWKRGNGLVDCNEESGEVVGKVADCSGNWWAFDTKITRPSDVLVMSSMKTRSAAGVYWMYYVGGCTEEAEIRKPDHLPTNLQDFEYCDGKIRVLRTRPGLMMSHDGRNWARIEGDHHSGSLFDVGTEKEWDSLYIAAPHVVFFNSDDLRLYYHSFDQNTGCFSIGYARSRDAMKWVKFGKVLGGGPSGSFDELGVKCPRVIPCPDGKGFLMLYEAVAADGSSSFGLARSDDGLSQWERCSDKPVFTKAGASSAWDGREIHSPCLLQKDGKEWCLYYVGVDSMGRSSVGMALCTDGKLLEFQRCHGLHI